MSMIRHIVCALIVISVMAFQSVSQAETPESIQEGQPISVSVFLSVPNDITSSTIQLANDTVDANELRCLARNIYYEAGSEPEEGKVAVGLVTINRSSDPRFAKTICGVIDQRISAHPHDHKNCQFSWRCMSVRLPKEGEKNWQECQRIAKALLVDPSFYETLRSKYKDALYFHTIHVRPLWVKHKIKIAQAGHQWFYRDA